MAECRFYGKAGGRRLACIVKRSRTEVLDRFQQIVARTDFVQEALRWPVLKSEMERGFDVIPTLVFVQFSNSRPNFELTGARTPPSTPMASRSSAFIILSRVLSSDRDRQGVDSVSNRPSIFDNDGSSHEGVLL